MANNQGWVKYTIYLGIIKKGMYDVKFNKKQIFTIFLVGVLCLFVNFYTTNNKESDSFINNLIAQTSNLIMKKNGSGEDETRSIGDSTDNFAASSEDMPDHEIAGEVIANNDSELKPTISDMKYNKKSFIINEPVDFILTLCETANSNVSRDFYVEIYSNRAFGDFLVASTNVKLKENVTSATETITISFDTLGTLNTTVKIYDKKGGKILYSQKSTVQRSVNYELTSSKRLTGIDTYSPLTATKCKELKAQGVSFIVRYYSTANSSKCITKNEAKIINDAGMQLVTVYQDRNNALSDFTYAHGKADGKAAIDFALKIGQPITTPIYFSIDYDANSSNISYVYKYFSGINDAMKEFKDKDSKGRYWQIGGYGSYFAVKSLYENGYATYIWQTKSWSGDKKYNYHLYQDKHDYTLCGIKVDRNITNPDKNNCFGGFFIAN